VCLISGAGGQAKALIGRAPSNAQNADVGTNESRQRMVGITGQS
jgi:hypothetical protein